MSTEKCIRDYTVINSQPSMEALKNLVSEIVKTFGFAETIDDMFYYGVFMKPQNYVNYKFDTSKTYDFEIPFNLTSVCAKNKEKIDYVQSVIKQIMKKEISKPEWMKWIEMDIECNEYGQASSTFLQIEAKEKQYEALAQKLIEFLYSPNLTITMIEC